MRLSEKIKRGLRYGMQACIACDYPSLSPEDFCKMCESTNFEANFYGTHLFDPKKGDEDPEIKRKRYER